MDQPVAKRTVRDDNSFLTNYPDHSYGPFGNKEEVSLMILFANDLDHPLWTVLHCKYFFAHDLDIPFGQSWIANIFLHMVRIFQVGKPFAKRTTKRAKI